MTVSHTRAFPLARVALAILAVCIALAAAGAISGVSLADPCETQGDSTCPSEPAPQAEPEPAPPVANCEAQGDSSCAHRPKPQATPKPKPKSAWDRMSPGQQRTATAIVNGIVTAAVGKKFSARAGAATAVVLSSKQVDRMITKAIVTIVDQGSQLQYDANGDGRVGRCVPTYAGTVSCE